MRLYEAITNTDNTYPNAFSMGEKTRWINRLDGKIHKEIFATHEGYELVPFTGYDESTDPETELLAEAPYDDIYEKYLIMQMDIANGETERAVNSAAVFESAYKEYANWFNRTARPIRVPKKYW